MNAGKLNPYAPPGAELGPGSDLTAGDAGPSDYAPERRPVILCIGLTLLTLGFYPSIWLLRRRPFLAHLQATKHLGATMPIITIVTGVMGLGLAFFGEEASAAQQLLQLVGTIAAVLANFRVAHILRSDSARTGRFLRFSTLGTFFLGIFYLQYKMNRLAETPAHKTRKKKTEKTSAASEGEPSTIPPAR